MAINVLSDPGSAPIIVGDAADMSDLQGVSSDAEGQYHLLMNGHIVALSSPASENFHTAKYLLLVDVEGDQVIRARRVKIDNLGNGSELTVEQCNVLGKALTLTEREDDAPEERKFYNAAIAEFKSRYPDLAAA